MSNLTALKRTFLTLTILTFSLVPTIAAAFDWDAAYHSNKYMSQFYDPNDLCLGTITGGDPGGDANVSNGTLRQNEEAAFKYFYVKLGGGPNAAIWSAGIVGNLKGESQVNPSSDNPAARGGGGGIAQWEGDRWSGPNGLLRFAASRGKPWTDLGVQLDFLWRELQTTESKALAALKRATTVPQAAIIFMLTFERPSIPRTAARISHAQQIYRDYNRSVLDLPELPGADPTQGAPEANCEAVAPETGPSDGNYIRDSSNETCPTGTENGGLGDGYAQGKLYRIRLCRANGIVVNVLVAKKVLDMTNRARSQGISLPGSGFRTMASQIRLRQTNGCPNIYTAPASSCRVPTARPGYSNHQMGLAIDFEGIGRTERSDPKYRWLAANARQFGFQNLPSEAWHWSVDGK